MERQPAEIDGIAYNDDLLRRRLAARDPYHRLTIFQPRRVFMRKATLVGDAERRGHAAAAAADGADDLEMLRPGILKQARLRRRFDHAADLGECNRLFVDLDLAESDQLLDEPAKPKSVEIDARARCHLSLCPQRIARLRGVSSHHLPEPRWR